MGICMLIGRVIFDFVFANIGMGGETSLSISLTVFRMSVMVLLSDEICSAGRRGCRGRAAERSGICKSTCSDSGEVGDMRTESSTGRCGTSPVGDGVCGPGDLAGASVIAGLFFCRISNVEFRCLMIVVTCFGACLGEMESLTGESGRVTLSALGGDFRTPLIIE